MTVGHIDVKETIPRGVKFTKEEPETRQVVDLNLEFIVTEYQAEVLLGDDGKRYAAPFPSHIAKAIQYGASVRSLSVYFLSISLFLMLEFNRCSKIKFYCL